MWKGGPLPLGYDVKDRKLVIVPEEAETVRDIMLRYLASNGIPELIDELERDGVVSKRRKMRDGSVAGGVPFRRGALAHLLSNRIYLGLITHKGEAYEGQHDAIVDRELFEQVQAKLARRGIERDTRAERNGISVLAGRISDQHGRAMTPTNTQNHGRRYRYYASIPRDGCHDPAVRLPAAELERAVRLAIAKLMGDPARVREHLGGQSEVDLAQAVPAAIRLGRALAEAEGIELKRKFAGLDLAVVVDASSIVATINLGSLVPASHSDKPSSLSATLSTPTSPVRTGHEPRLKLDPPPGVPSRAGSALVDLIARAFAAREQLLDMDEQAVSAVAIRHRRHLERTARLSYLAPDIISAIINRRRPLNLAARNLVRMASLPLDWAAQRRALQLDSHKPS